MVPRRDWFLKQPPNGIHGSGHAARVMVWATVLAGESSLFEPALWAAACHDLRREDEGVDPGHGDRAAIWVMEELPRFLEQTPEELERIANACRWHVHADDEVQSRDDLVWLLKDADALDRVRLGDLDPSYFRSDKAVTLVGDAQKLYTKTRRFNDPVDIWSEAFRLGLEIDRLLDYDFGLKPEEASAR